MEQELSLKDVLKSVKDHSALVNHAIAVEEESRTGIRLRLDDQDSSILRIVNSTAGLGSFQEDLIQMVDRLGERLLTLERSLEFASDNNSRRSSSRHVPFRKYGST